MFLKHQPSWRCFHGYPFPVEAPPFFVRCAIQPFRIRLRLHASFRTLDHCWLESSQGGFNLAGGVMQERKFL